MKLPAAAGVLVLPLIFAAGAVAARCVLARAPLSIARDLAQPLLVVTAWNGYGGLCFAVLALTLACAAGALYVAFRGRAAHPRGLPFGAIIAAATLSLAACFAWPFIFSSDVYAYAAYGDLAQRSLDPYALAPAALHDAYVDAARWQWSGAFPPCVYGPLFIAVARAVVGLTAAGGIGLTLLGLRLAACAAFLLSLVSLNAALRGAAPGRRCLALCAYGLNPAILWSAAEGHNDAFLLLAACAAAALARSGRATLGAFLLGLSPILKAPGAVLALGAALEITLVARIKSARLLVALGLGVAAAALLAIPPLVPVLRTLGTHGKYSPAISVQGLSGAGPAFVLAAVAAAFGLRQLVRRRRDGFAWLGIGLLVALPNPYPWYAFWLVPFGLAARGGYAAAALWGATISSAMRYLPDATGHLSVEGARLAAALSAIPLALAFRQFGEAAPLRKKAPVQS